MIILGLSDIHGDISKLNRIRSFLEEADLVLLVGDITGFGKEKEAAEVVNAIKKHSGQVLGVSGNCDFPQVDSYLSLERINIHGSNYLLDGIYFAGLGGSLPTPFNTPNETSEGELEAALSKAGENIPFDSPVILVSHQPPKNTKCDQIGTGQHVGSLSVRSFIEQRRPMICFTGHIHEGDGIDKIGETSIINPGPFPYGGFALAEVDIKSKEPVKNLLVKKF